MTEEDPYAQWDREHPNEGASPVTAPAPPLGPPVLPAVIPSFERRLAVGILLLIGMLFVGVIFPYEAWSVLQQYHIVPNYPVGPILVLGVIWAALGAIGHVAQPTRAYGQLVMAEAGVLLGYLSVLIAYPGVSIHIQPGSVVVFSAALLWALMTPVAGLRFLSGLVTTIEDYRRPGERLPFDFPPP